MPFLFIAIGSSLVLSGIVGNPSDFFQLVFNDFEGSGSGSTVQHGYIYWVIAIIVLGLLGYVESLKGLSRTFVALVIVVLLLHNQGFFSQFQKQVFGSTTQ